ncbi:hypothetical protein OROGR_002180 [Orobanche gracilis]
MFRHPLCGAVPKRHFWFCTHNREPMATLHCISGTTLPDGSRSNRAFYFGTNWAFRYYNI